MVYSQMSEAEPDSCGLYFLANDNVLDYSITLFQSFRFYNKKLPAYLIPFDENIDDIKGILHNFNIDILNYPTLCDLDQVGNRLWENNSLANHMFRKFACFWGPFEIFFYIDADCAILDDPEILISIFAEAEVDFLTFDNDMERVYEKGDFRDLFVEKYHSKGFNAGAFLSRKGVFNFEEILNFAEEAVPYTSEFSDVVDQSFFNFCIDKKGVSHVRLPEIRPEYADKAWGDQVPINLDRGKYRIMNKKSPDFDKLLPFIHWAGHKASTPFPNRHIYYRYRLMNMKFNQRLCYYFSDQLRWRTQGIRLIFGFVLHKMRRLFTKIGCHKLANLLGP